MTLTASRTDTHKATGTPRTLSAGKLLLQGRAFLALVLVIVVFSILSPNYLTVDNVLTMSSHVAIYALLALGMLLVILNGGIDLSVGSTLGLSGVVAGWLMQVLRSSTFGVTFFPAVWVVAIVCILVGALVGLVNGILIARFKVAPFVATLGTLYVVRGIGLLKTNGLTYDNLSGDPRLGNTGFNWLGFNKLFGVPVGVLIMIVVAALISLSLNRSVFGRWLYSSGGNERAAELSGVPVRKVKVRVYVISGACAAIAGLILSSELTSAGPTAGLSYELTAIAAVVIGGTRLSGGAGTILGSMIGALILSILDNILGLRNIQSEYQMILKGVIIVLAVVVQRQRGSS